MTARTTLFWLGLPLRLFVAALVWLVWRMCEPGSQPIDWRKVACVGLDAGISI